MKKPKRSSKPTFIRQESWRLKRIKSNWRRPRGKTSWMRRNILGSPPIVKIGYGGPKKYRSLHPSGYREVLVHNADELMAVNPKIEAARIASTVGEKKRFIIMAKAEELGIKVFNPPKAEETETTEAEPESETTEKPNEDEKK